MDANRFDAIVRALSAVFSRRGAIATGAATLAAVTGAGAAKKRKKPQLNAFGCVDVGGLCFGKGGLCCSGICAGKKPKKGKKDKRRCAAHDASTCLAGDDACNVAIVACTTANGNPGGECLRTTGAASYCTAAEISCRQCTRDDDCVAACGAGAACVLCDGAGIGCFANVDRYCVGLDRTCDPL